MYCRPAFVVSVLVLGASGCALYTPPQGAQIASIGPDDETLEADDEYLYIERIDGARVPYTWSGKLPKRLRSVQSASDFSVAISPGEREIGIRACAVTETREHRCTRARLHIAVLQREEYRIQARYSEGLDSVDLSVESLTGPSRTNAKRLKVHPCSVLAASNPLRAYITCDKLDVVDVLLSPTEASVFDSS